MRAKKNGMDILSFGEFEQRVLREPSLDGTWVYKLEQAFFDEDIKNPYPMFDLDYREERLFLSFDDAVKYLRENKREDTYCSWVSQVPCGERIYEHAAVWLFDCNGNIIDYTTTYSFGDGWEANFYGRPANRQRFKKGI